LPLPLLLVTALTFVVLFWDAMVTLGRDWWNDPEAGHGLLLAPLALYLAWKTGLGESVRPRRVAGAAILLVAVLFRHIAELAAELFTLRFAMVLALCGLVVYMWGYRQVWRWWLPLSLLVLSIPLPSVVVASLALPLQLHASSFGASLLEWRDVPVTLAGNVIHLPGRSLFVTEACSGLRSLTALASLGLLMGGLWLRSPLSRAVTLLITIGVAVVVNGFRVFLTGFLVFFVDPSLGQGFMHYSEGWALFMVAFVVMGGVTWTLMQLETLLPIVGRHVRARFAGA
jgi:exosortase